MTTRKHSALFRHIEAVHAGRPFGALLDAGTGVNSIRWIIDLETERWTAVTGSAQHAAQVRDVAGARMRAEDRILTGNWADPEFLEGETFDTVLADYLLGAVEGFAPYFQPYLFGRLRPLTRGTLYVTGLEPYVPARPQTKAGRIVWEIGRFRDACLLLSGDMPYREYPARWVADQLKRAGFTIGSVRHFSILYKERFVNTQIDMCAPRIAALPDRTLAAALTARGEALRSEALSVIAAEGALRHGRDYVIAAVPG